MSRALKVAMHVDGPTVRGSERQSLLLAERLLAEVPDAERLATLLPPVINAIVRALHADDQLTVRIAYNLFTQNRGGEREDFERWSRMLSPREGDAMLRHNGAGEMLVFSAADFEDFLEPRPDLPQTMEEELEPVVRHLVEQRWPFRLHATYDETIARSTDPDGRLVEMRALAMHERAGVALLRGDYEKKGYKRESR